MSLEGMVSVRGARCRIRRSAQASGVASVTQRTWADAASSPVKMLLEELTAGKAQRIWGMETVATVRATLPAGTDVQRLDGVIVLDGKFVGRHYTVVENPSGSALGSQLVLLGLQQTREKFGL